jgi:glucose/arabinose dehydrogenase
MTMSRRIAALLIGTGVLFGSVSCYSMRGSSGGGQTRFTPPRLVRAADVALPPGYRIEPVATELTFPVGVTIDDKGRVFVVESGYSYGEVWTTPRLLRIESDGKATPIASGTKNGPWNGVTYHQGAFYVAEGGEMEGGRILRIAPDGTITPILTGLPSMGDHHTNGPVIGPDGALYFGQGTATNSAVVGEDNAQFGWLARQPKFHDTPCQDVTVTGQNFTSGNPLTPDANDRATTGAFSAFGTETRQGQVIPGAVPCNGAVMKVALQGGKPELVAWGFRNPFGLAFSPKGELYITDNSYDDRGSRPVWGTGDLLIAVKPGTWYGWPDYHGDHPLTEDRHDPPGGKPQPQFVLSKHPNVPPRPVAQLGVHSSSNGIDFSRNDSFGYVGQAFIAQLGDMAPTAGKVLRPVGFKVVRVEVGNGAIEDFAVNRGGTNGPASRLRSGGLERPVSLRFDPSGQSLYVVDFGVMTMTVKGASPQQRTGVLWRITRGQP